MPGRARSVVLHQADVAARRSIWISTTSAKLSPKLCCSLRQPFSCSVACRICRMWQGTDFYRLVFFTTSHSSPMVVLVYNNATTRTPPRLSHRPLSNIHLTRSSSASQSASFQGAGGVGKHFNLFSHSGSEKPKAKWRVWGSAAKRMMKSAIQQRWNLHKMKINKKFYSRPLSWAVAQPLADGGR